MSADVIMTLRAPDRPGIVAALATALAAAGCDIRDAAVFGDEATRAFFVRMHLSGADIAPARLSAATAPIAARLDAEIEFRPADAPMRIVIAVSRAAHCLADLLHRRQAGSLPVEIARIVANHDDLRSLSDWHGVPFERLPDAAAARDGRLVEIMEETGAELLVLARFMQVLGAEACAAFAGRCINIHHSFLPSFKGAGPYRQAHARGVKLIGATAHYVTEALDEGPIIEQDVRRVSHTARVADFIAEGREVEARVLARAVRWHAERRVFISGARTIVLA